MEPKKKGKLSLLRPMLGISIGIGGKKKKAPSEPPPDPESEDSEEDMGEGEGEDSGMGVELSRELITAIEEKDAEGVMSAFRALVEHCSHE